MIGRYRKGIKGEGERKVRRGGRRRMEKWNETERKGNRGKAAEKFDLERR